MVSLLELPDELVALVLRTVVGPTPSVVATIVSLQKLCSICTRLKGWAEEYKDKDQTLSSLDVEKGASWQQMAIALALEDALDEDGGNRIGFEFASHNIAGDAGRGSDVMGSFSRLRIYAAILERPPRATGIVEAHTGASAGLEPVCPAPRLT